MLRLKNTPFSVLVFFFNIMEKTFFQHREKKFFSTSWKKIFFNIMEKTFFQHHGKKIDKNGKNPDFFHGFFENSPDWQEMPLQDDFMVFCRA